MSLLKILLNSETTRKFLEQEPSISLHPLYPVDILRVVGEAVGSLCGQKSIPTTGPDQVLNTQDNSRQSLTCLRIFRP